MPRSRITLQHLMPPVESKPIEARDAHFANSIQISPPPAILLDYMYGAAAYRRWGAGESMDGLMQRRFVEYYKPIPLLPRSPSSSESGDSRDDDFEPRTQPGRRRHRTDMSTEMLQAMDNILRLSMWLKGTTPEEVAAERERRREEEELRAQKAGRVKVLEWLQSDVCSLSCQANSTPANTKCLTQK
jgi:hypothetical protein